MSVATNKRLALMCTHKYPKPIHINYKNNLLFLLLHRSNHVIVLFSLNKIVIMFDMNEDHKHAMRIPSDIHRKSK